VRFTQTAGPEGNQHWLSHFRRRRRLPPSPRCSITYADAAAAPSPLCDGSATTLPLPQRRLLRPGGAPALLPGYTPPPVSTSPLPPCFIPSFSFEFGGDSMIALFIT